MFKLFRFSLIITFGTFCHNFIFSIPFFSYNLFACLHNVFFRVNYDKQNWALLVEQLLRNHTAIHVNNRAQIIDDAFNLARANLLDYETALSVTEYLHKEVDYVPWNSALSG